MIFPVLGAEKGIPENTSHTAGYELGFLRVLSGIWTRYGAAAAQNFAVYEKFSGKKHVGTSRT